MTSLHAHKQDKYTDYFFEDDGQLRCPNPKCRAFWSLPASGEGSKICQRCNKKVRAEFTSKQFGESTDWGTKVWCYK